MTLPRGRRPLLIGLTGPIGCGKSTVAGMLAEAGGRAIDADALARAVTGPGQPALAEIRARFGDSVFAADVLDRAALAAVVFADPAALGDLEAIVHPRVRLQVEADLAAALADGVELVTVEAIKLIEGGLADRCDEVWIVDCPPAVQRARLAGRGMSRADIERRLAAQGDSLAARLAADVAGRHPVRLISTAGPREETRRVAMGALAEALDRLAD